VFEGTADAVERMIEFCHEGSDAARVEAVDVTYEAPEGESGFRVRW
jgi:acylphosphatase